MIKKFSYTGLGQSTDIEVRLYSNELSELGGKVPLAIWEGKGDFFEAATEAATTANPASAKSKHTSTILINGDPFDIKEAYVSGEVRIGNQVFNITKFKRRRNPDGTVHHIVFEVS